jgi:hypothetical protein
MQLGYTGEAKRSRASGAPKQQPRRCQAAEETRGPQSGRAEGGAKDQWISGSVAECAPTEEPRPNASNARRQRPATRATGVSRAFACVLNTRGCPQVFYTAPVIHPVRVHKFP